MSEAVHNVKGSQPERIYTDSLRSYGIGISAWPDGAKPEHIANSGIRKHYATNDRIGRLNGTLRERVRAESSH